MFGGEGLANTMEGFPNREEESKYIDKIKVVEEQLLKRSAHAALQAGVERITLAALSLIQKDPHQWSNRPCATCEAVSALIGRPFGCVYYKERN